MPTRNAAWLLDCDGVLLDTERVWTDAEHATVIQWGGEWSSDLKGTLLGQTTHRTAALIGQHVRAPRGEHSEIHRAMLRAFDMRIDAGHVRPIDGALDLLDTLTRRAIPIVVVSNSPRTQVAACLDLVGIHAPVVCADDEGLRPKPAPDLYQRGCRLLDADPHHSVAVEDSPVGVAAAVAAGLFTLSFPSDIAGADRSTSCLWPLDVDALLASASARQR